MDFNRIKIKTVLRVLLIVISTIVAVILFEHTDFYITATFIALSLIIQIIVLINRIDAANEKISRFFYAIAHADFTQTFYKGNEDKHLRELNNSLNEVIKKFREIRNSGEERELFLQTITHHIGTGLLVVDEFDEILLLNTTARRLLDLRYEKRLEDINGPAEVLISKLKDKKSGNEFLIRIPHHNEIIQLAISITYCRIKEVQVRIIAIQDIGKELDNKELESWQLLTRVLAHEIMNSMTPIISLADSALKSISNEGELLNLGQSDLVKSVETIGRRAQSLTKFVDSYRSLTNIPRPNFSKIKLNLWMPGVIDLLREDFKSNQIILSLDINPERLELYADPVLIEQVIINLLLNSINALKESPKPRIIIKVYEDTRNRVCIDISDNGKGVSGELKDEIFIPFFTTRKGGSGIGLSLCRQIMHLHAGSVQLNYQMNDQTTFTLRF